MSESRSFPDTFGEQEVSMQNDPSFLQYAARLDATQDFDNEIPLLDGLLSRRECGHCLTELEVTAYRDQYQRLALQKVASDSGIANIVCEPFCPW